MVRWFRLPTTNYQLPTINYQLPTTNYQLSTTNYQLSTINYQLSTTNYQLIGWVATQTFEHSIIRLFDYSLGSDALVGTPVYVIGKQQGQLVKTTFCRANLRGSSKNDCAGELARAPGRSCFKQVVSNKPNERDARFTWAARWGNAACQRRARRARPTNW